MTQQYERQIVAITGASSGIGMEVARELARRGGHAIVIARRSDELNGLKEDIVREGGCATAIPCDVTKESEVDALTNEVRERFGRLDMLVNNAGRELMLPLQLTKPQTARDLLDLNVVSIASLVRGFLPLLGNGGSVVNIASAVALRPAACLSMYAASKAAVIAFTRSIARELAPRGIRVNAVAPGFVRTNMADRIFSKMTPEQVTELELLHPLGFGSPRDVALGVAFLGSNEAAWITGHTLVVDGGFTA